MVGNTQCFAYKNGKCAATTKSSCFCCRFFKTKERLRQERAQSLDRIIKLPIAQQVAIEETYYKNNEYMLDKAK